MALFGHFWAFLVTKLFPLASKWFQNILQCCTKVHFYITTNCVKKYLIFTRSDRSMPNTQKLWTRLGQNFRLVGHPGGTTGVDMGQQV